VRHALQAQRKQVPLPQARVGEVAPVGLAQRQAECRAQILPFPYAAPVSAAEPLGGPEREQCLVPRLCIAVGTHLLFQIRLDPLKLGLIGFVTIKRPPVRRLQAEPCAPIRDRPDLSCARA
jgi:hypothetical protein